MEYYFAGSLTKADAILPGVSKGIAHMGKPAAAYYPSQLPLTHGAEMPYICNDPWVAAKAFMELYNTYPAVKEEYDKQKVKVLYAHGVPGTVLGFIKKPVKTLDDLKGLKIRALGTINQVIAKLGATPVAISIGEVYGAMERGIMDGYCGVPLFVAGLQKYYEVAPYLTNPGIGTYVIVPVVFNLDKWNSLPADIRKIMEDLSQETIALEAKWQMEIDNNLAAQWVKGGGTIYRLPAEERARWKAQVKPETIWGEWIKELEKKKLPAKQFLDQFVDLVKKYEAQSLYSWPRGLE